MKARVQLFKGSGKWYCDEEWEIPNEVPVSAFPSWETRPVIGPYDMKYSPDFRTIGVDGYVLVEEQGPWGYPCIILPDFVKLG